MDRKKNVSAAHTYILNVNRGILIVLSTYDFRDTEGFSPLPYIVGACVEYDTMVAC